MMKVLSGLSHVLFHITGPAQAVKIVGRNVFNLTPSDGSVQEEQIVGGQLFYLSTARSMHSDFIRKSMGRGSVVFQLDGRKLQSTYTGKAVDFWSQSSYMRTDEMEDRVIVKDKSAIPAVPFITAVYQRLIEDNMRQAMSNAYKEQVNLYKLCAKHRIPVYYFKDSKDLLNRNMKKAIKWEPGIEPSNPVDEEISLEYVAAANRLACMMELATSDKIPSSKAGKEMLKMVINKPSDFSYLVHNTVRMVRDKNPGYSETGLPRENLDRYWKVIRNHKLRDAYGLADYIITKWEATIL